MKRFVILFSFAASALLVGGCATLPSRDYSQFIQHTPRTILILPPRNLTSELNANYSFYTQSAKSLADQGYYVYPTVLVDQFFKQNGVFIADEMHEIPLKRLYEIFQADAVLYIDVVAYGTKYVVLSSDNIVAANAILLDSRTGLELWRGSVSYSEPGSNGVLEALVEQLINKLTDQAHRTAGVASELLYRTKGQGIPVGIRHPDFGKPES